MRTLASSKFMQSMEGNPGWNDFLGGLAFADARKSVRSGMVLAAISGATCMTSKNIFLRGLAIGIGVGGFLAAAKQTNDGVKLKRGAAKLRNAIGQRPEPILPKPPKVMTTNAVAKP